MLVLSRRTGERIVISVPNSNDVVIVTLVENCGRGNGVRLGVDAPREYKVMREELLTEAERKALPKLDRVFKD
jgi:carbon storage regulator